MRHTGIPSIGNVPWGTHFCQFYENEQDLIDILVPYFKAGLENNEFCMWITSEPLRAEEAKAALAREVADLERYIRNGQLEILDYSDWYTLGGAFNSERVLQAWVERLEKALQRGLGGLRLSGNTFWLEKSDWRDFTEYEAAVDRVIGQLRMLAICTYSLAKCGAPEIMDVVSNHAFALIKRAGKWDIIESAERKKIEASLRESEQRYRRLFHAMSEGFAHCEIICDRAGLPSDFRYLAMNPTFERQTGLKMEEVLGRTLLELFPQAERVWIERYGKVALTGESARFEEWFGPLGRWFEVSVFQSEPGRFGVVFADVTERRRADDELRRQREWLRVTLSSIGDAVLATDSAGRVSFLNLVARSLTGWTEEQALGVAARDVFRTINEDTREAGEDVIGRVLRENRTVELANHTALVTRDGREIPIEDSAAPIRDSSGKPAGVVLVFHDVTEKRRAGEALKQQAALLKLSNDAMIVWRLEGSIESWNDGAKRLYGYAESEAVGKITHTLLATTFPQPWEQIHAKIVQGGSWEGELWHRTRDGREIVVSARLQLVRMSDGVDRVLEVNRDITEKKKAEERLRHSQKLESLGLLAGGVAHDFNNLLVGVVGNASLAQEMLPPEHPAAELMATVVKTGEQAAHLTRQMLAYSGKGKFLLEILDISALARDIIELARPSIPKKIALNLNLEEELPIEADRGQVQQIVMNLAINAAEAIGSNDGLITVRTASETVDNDYLRQYPEAADLRPGRYAVLEVIDNGCGMDDDTKAKIFDPFFSTKFTGRGLGLAAVAGIVRGHKGAILVTSKPGKGSAFTVLFPAAERAAEMRPEAVRSAVPQGSGVILVIDDEQVVRTMATRALERSGYTVLAADSGPAAINLLKRHPGKIDLAVLDLSMPGMSGEETLPELRKIRPEIKVFVSSGYSETEAMTMFRGQRVSGFVQKPYTSGALADKVKLALG